MGNKMDNVNFLNDCVASDLLDSHVLGNDKLGGVPTMERSRRSSLDANSVDVSKKNISFTIRKERLFITQFLSYLLIITVSLNDYNCELAFK